MALPLWHTLNICFEIKLVGSKSKYYIIRQRKLLLQFNFTWTVQFSWKIYKGWINLAYFTEPLIDGYFHYLATSMKYVLKWRIKVKYSGFPDPDSWHCTYLRICLLSICCHPVRTFWHYASDTWELLRFTQCTMYTNTKYTHQTPTQILIKSRTKMIFLKRINKS